MDGAQRREVIGVETPHNFEKLIFSYNDYFKFLNLNQLVYIEFLDLGKVFNNLDQKNMLTNFQLLGIKYILIDQNNLYQYQNAIIDYGINTEK